MKAATNRDHPYEDTGDARPVPIHEIGCAFVLTELLAASLPSGTAIEALLLAARRIGWQPVGDVLRSAIERCLARRHLEIDAQQRLVITPAGRRWLTSVMAQNFAVSPACCSDMLLACQRRTAAKLSPQAGARIRKAIDREQHPQPQPQACAAMTHR